MYDAELTTNMNHATFFSCVNNDIFLEISCKIQKNNECFNLFMRGLMYGLLRSLGKTNTRMRAHVSHDFELQLVVAMHAVTVAGFDL